MQNTISSEKFRIYIALYKFCLLFNWHFNCTCSPSFLSFSNSYRESSVSCQSASLLAKRWWDHIFLKITKSCKHLEIDTAGFWATCTNRNRPEEMRSVGAGRPSSLERMSGRAPLRLEPDAQLMPQSPQKGPTNSLRQSIRFILCTMFEQYQRRCGIAWWLLFIELSIFEPECALWQQRSVGVFRGLSRSLE